MASFHPAIVLNVSASNCVCCRLRKRDKGCFCDIGFFVNTSPINFLRRAWTQYQPPPPHRVPNIWQYLQVKRKQRSLVEMLPAENRDQIRIRLNHCGSWHKISRNFQLIRTSLWASEAGNGVWRSSSRCSGLLEFPKIAGTYRYKPRGTRMLWGVVHPVNNWIKKGIESDQGGCVLMMLLWRWSRSSSSHLKQISSAAAFKAWSPSLLLPDCPTCCVVISRPARSPISSVKSFRLRRGCLLLVSVLLSSSLVGCHHQLPSHLKYIHYTGKRSVHLTGGRRNSFEDENHL